MGEFSWLYANTQKQMINYEVADSYLLVPEPFQSKYGEYIYEGCYEGNGIFGVYDVYELVAEWNRDFIPSIIERSKVGTWEPELDDEDIKNFQHFYHRDVDKMTCDTREIGILMACYDYGNCQLPYPIKITSKPAGYRYTNISLIDPNQGRRKAGILFSKSLTGESAKEREYTFKVSLCDGQYCDGAVTVKAENEDLAEDLALDYVVSKLFNALPELGIEVEVELAKD